MMEHGIRASTVTSFTELLKRLAKLERMTKIETFISIKIYFFQKLNENTCFMIGTAMKHLLLFILFMLSQAHAYIRPHDINHAFFTHKFRPIYTTVRYHRARRCHDDCSLTEFKGEF